MSLKLLLCDENIPYAVFSLLKQRGFDVACVTPGIPDDKVAVIA